MEQRTKNRIALGVAIGCGVVAVAWRVTHPSDAATWTATWTTTTPATATVSATATATVTPSATTTAPAASAHPHLDRARADEMREKLRALLAEAGPAWGAPETPSAGTTSRPTPGAGGLYPEMPPTDLRDDAGVSENGKYLQRRVREDLFPLAKDCYARELEKNPKLAGRFVMNFRIVGDRRIGGVVDTATMDPSSTLTDPEFARCLTESMMSVTFDAPPGNREVTVTYPIEFSPEDDDAGPDAAR